jgi:cupin-like protein
MAHLLQLGDAPFDLDSIRGVRHELPNHPLLSVEKLRGLAHRLASVRFHSGKLSASDSFERAATEHPNGMTLDQTLEGLENAGSWVYLQHVETDPEYKLLVDEVLDCVQQQLPKRNGPLLQRSGWVFLSSPGAVTPYHMDHEQNFLLQVRGSKIINVWDPRDRTVVGERELESFHATYSLKETKYRDDLQPKARVFHAKAGEGAYMPYTAPHWVTNGPEVSVTFSCTFVTAAAQRQSQAFAANHRLRSLGLSPTPVGHSPMRDTLKSQALRAWKSTRELIGKSGR